jgi:hypothetical protein
VVQLPDPIHRSLHEKKLTTYRFQTDTENTGLLQAAIIGILSVAWLKGTQVSSP